MVKHRRQFVCQNCNAVGGTSHTGLCVRCYNKEYYKQNKDSIKEKTRKWEVNNKERVLRYKREYYHRNKKVRTEKIKTKKHCSECGDSRDDIRYVGNKCRRCHQRERYRETHPKQVKLCIDCGKEVGQKNTSGRCNNCRVRERYRNDHIYRDKIKERNKENNKKPKYKEKKRLAVIKRRTLIRNAEFSLTQREWEGILEKFNNTCAYCGETGKLEMDHVIPVSKGGSTTKENIVPACRTCNSKKGNKLIFPIKGM